MENIEAMLCAYIEGDLDQAGRAEIERHLREHPQHKKLIEELIATRKLLCDLPQVAAPAEIAEALRGQMERSILLDGDLAPARATPIGWRWAPRLAVAAVFLMTTGVGLLVYRMVMPTLKPAKFVQVTVSPATNAESGPMTDDTAAAPTAAATVDAEHRADLAAHDILVAAPPDAVVSRDLDVVRQRVQVLNGTTVTPVYWVVDSYNPVATENRIASFLNSNGITFTPIADQTESTGMGAASGMLRMDAAMPPAAPMAPLPASRPAEEFKTINGAAPTTQPMASAADATPNEPKDVAESPSPTVPATMPTASLEQSPPLQPALAPTTMPSDIRGIYVVRGISHKQAELLRSSLSSEDAATRLDVIAQSSATAAAPGATTRPSEDVQNAPPAIDEIPNKPAAADDAMDVVIVVHQPESAATRPAPAQ